MERKNEINHIMKEIEEAGCLLWEQKSDGYKKVQEIVKQLGNIIPEILDFLLLYDVDGHSAEMMIAQLQAINKGLENRDVVCLADTLNYELYNVLAMYQDIAQYNLVEEN